MSHTYLQDGEAGATSTKHSEGCKSQGFRQQLEPPSAGVVWSRNRIHQSFRTRTGTQLCCIHCRRCDRKTASDFPFLTFLQRTIEMFALTYRFRLDFTIRIRTSWQTDCPEDSLEKETTLAWILRKTDIGHRVSQYERDTYYYTQLGGQDLTQCGVHNGKSNIELI